MGIAETLFARFYDRMTAGAEKAGLRAHREALLTKASGKVLEIGGGTGANLPFYGTGVESLTIPMTALFSGLPSAKMSMVLP